MTAREEYMIYVPTLGDRLRRALGYRQRLPEDFDPEPNDCPYWAKTVIIVRFDWRDRLRLLLTGGVEVATEHRTSEQIEKMIGHTAVTLLGPGDRRLKKKP
jgi:hypothetical protein